MLFQAGIGTYVKRQFFTQTLSKVSTMLDSAIALGLNEHVKDGQVTSVVTPIQVQQRFQL
jgi:hypothetical protein